MLRQALIGGCAADADDETDDSVSAVEIHRASDSVGCDAQRAGASVRTQGRGPIGRSIGLDTARDVNACADVEPPAKLELAAAALPEVAPDGAPRLHDQVLRYRRT